MIKVGYFGNFRVAEYTEKLNAYISSATFQVMIVRYLQIKVNIFW